MSKTTHVNPISGRPFKAEEAAALDAALKARRFTAPQWATYQQWKGTGRTVKPGETGTVCTGTSGFQWRVFNIAQTVGEGEAEAARAPVVTPAPAPKERKAKPIRAPESKKVSGAPSAPAVSNAKPHRAPAAAPAPRPISATVTTPERVATLIRCNPYFALNASEARRLAVLYPTMTHFDAEHIAQVYEGQSDEDTPRGQFRIAEAQRWFKVRADYEKRHPAAIGKARTRAWLAFTGRAEEAKAYGTRKPGVRVEAAALQPCSPPPAADSDPAPQPEPPTPPQPARLVDWRAGFRRQFVKAFGKGE